MQKQDVNVRMRIQRAAAKTPESNQCELPRLGLRSNQFVPKAEKDLFHQRRAFGNSSRPAAVAYKILLNLFRPRQIEVPELSTWYSGCTHDVCGRSEPAEPAQFSTVVGYRTVRNLKLFMSGITIPYRSVRKTARRRGFFKRVLWQMQASGH